MSEQPDILKPGTFVGDLQVQQVLGAGAFGATYLVTDPAIGTSFALKEYLPAGLATRQPDGYVKPKDQQAEQAFSAGLKQFLAEARIVAALDHPNVARVLRYFEVNGTAYTLMTWYRGKALHERLQSGGTLDPARTRALMLSMLDAVEYINRQGIVHLDIKPANILVTEDARPILLDFGVAAAATQPRQDSEHRLGSAGYAAPEQSEPGGQTGPWSDVYGLAATLYRCITGRVPIAAAQRAAALTAGEPDPLPAASGLVPSTDFMGITDAIERGLAVDPEDRFSNAGEWRKSFQGLDWRRSVIAGEASGEFAPEGREWLPSALLGIFLLLMLAVLVYLVFVKPADPDSTVPGRAMQPPGEETQAGPQQTVSAEETARWEAALEADTLMGYRRFIEDYPASVYLNQAKIQLDILDDRIWQELAAEDSPEAFEAYLEQFPAGRHQAEALVRIDEIQKSLAQAERERLQRERLEQQAWNTAIGERSVAAMDRYISDWPAGPHIEEAGRIRRQLLDTANDEKTFEAARQLNTREALQAYLDAFPQGSQVASALQIMDQLTLRPGNQFRDCAECPGMIVVPAGSFWQGSDEASGLALSMEKPRRLVTIAEPFAIGKHEVTMAEWDACFADRGCSTQPSDNGWGRGTRPVIMVSWNDAQEYVEWLSRKTGQAYRLPSESEWEYAARAGEESDWPGGDSASVCSYANIAGSETEFRWQHPDCSDSQPLGTVPAVSLAANAFGLHDVIGNVAEWTADCMNLSYLDAPVDGSAWGRGICSSHTTRGGSWVTGTRDVRLPARFNLKNGDRNDFTGFRVVRPVAN